MNKEKQIEEMAKAIFMNCHCGLFEDEAEMIAKWCYQEIDRKASDVAEEIIRILRAAGINEHRYPVVAKIRKKYTEDTE
jgi:hypothetical protein